ncbi:hypothetical protein Gotur_011886, partial [Gossypium turneri]
GSTTLITVVVVSWETFDQCYSKYRRSGRICLKETVFHRPQLGANPSGSNSDIGRATKKARTRSDLMTNNDDPTMDENR